MYTYIEIYYIYLYTLGVQISSVRLKMHLFQNKMNEQINCIFHRSLLLFLISQAIFEFHLEKMIRLWRRSNFGANFRFLRKK